jgi:phage repressor protein C with HTH and peptisase S24 domain
VPAEQAPASPLLPWGLAVVNGRSMEPTLLPGDRVLVRYGARVRPGDLVLVDLPPGPDGPRPLAVKRATRRESGDRWWVESDNPSHGTDSRTLGALPASAVRARVVLRLPRWARRAGTPPAKP